MKAPTPPQIGPPAWKKWAEKMAEAHDASIPVSGLGTTVGDVTGGRSVNVSSIGGISGINSLQLINASDESGKKIRISYGTVAGEAPSGMSPGDDPPFLLSGISGSGYVYAKITYTATTGDITDRSIEKRADEPSEEDGILWVQIGSWSIDDDDILHLTNARYGPIDVTICRDWYSSPASYSASVA